MTESVKRPAVLYVKNTLTIRVREKYNTFNDELIEKVFKKDDPLHSGTKISALPKIDSLFNRKNLIPYLIEVLDADIFNPLFKDWFLIDTEPISYIALASMDSDGPLEFFPKVHSLLLALTSVLIVTDSKTESTGGGDIISGETGLIISPFDYGGFPLNIKTIQYGLNSITVTINNGEEEVFREVSPFGDKKRAKDEGDGDSKGAYVIKGIRAVFSDVKPDASYPEGESPTEVTIKSITALGLAESQG